MRAPRSRTLVEAADQLDQPVEDFGTFLQQGAGGHRGALAHVEATPEDDLLDLIVGDARLPRRIGVVVRLGVEAVREDAVAGAVEAVAPCAPGVVQRLNLRELALAALPGRRRAVFVARPGESGAGDKDRDYGVAHDEPIVPRVRGNCDL